VKAFFYKGGIYTGNNALPLGHWASDYGTLFPKRLGPILADLKNVTKNTLKRLKKFQI